MKLRVVDQNGTPRDYVSQLVPRVGERVVLTYGVGDKPVQDHYFRVRDVMYRLDNEPEDQPAILVTEEENAEPWPG